MLEDVASNVFFGFCLDAAKLELYMNAFSVKASARCCQFARIVWIYRLSNVIT